MGWITFIFLVGIGFLIIMGGLVMVAKFYRKVEQGKALIVNKMKADPDVTFTGDVVLPIIHKAEVMDISVKTIEIDRRGKEGLICQDNIRADIVVTFFVRVNKTKEDVIKVAQSIGCERASDRTTLQELFNAKFSEALKTVGKQLDFIDLYTKRDDFRDRIIQIIGRDLNGYVLEDAAIDYLEQTPLSSLDEHNILDAQGIRKITDLTTSEHVRTNEFTNNERKLIKKQDVEADETILELERQKADAVAKQQREIETMKAREEAETMKVQAEERLRSETARIHTAEEVEVAEENRQRQVEVAGKNRERVVAVETERVERERALEEVARIREVEIAKINMNKELEVEKKAIAEVTAERISVEKGVAQEEERIKELRVVEEAKRTKEAMIITAEAQAQEQLVKDIKAAEAQEVAATHHAKEQLTLAEAGRQVADKEAAAKIRLADGIKAQEAAAGLAAVQVQEAEAVAIEKVGLARVKVRDAEAEVMEKEALGQAAILREKGSAQAAAIRDRMNAEAEGIQKKAESMKAFDATSIAHEEYRLQIDKSKEVELADIQARRQVAEEQAKVLSEAFQEADIDIIGGDSLVVDRVLNAVAMGRAVDGFSSGSQLGRQTMDAYLDGDRNLSEDLTRILEAAGGSEGLTNLSVSALITRLATASGGDRKAKLEALAAKARELGLGR